MTNDSRTLAWIFYSIAIASGNTPASRREISVAADAINHAVPTQQELDGALKQLVGRGLVETRGKFHHITPSGRMLFQRAQEGRTTVTAVWRALASMFAGAS
ncbi:hypothetical protein [Pseudoxanthomonas sp.]|uniref:hypothetical protein n=1 Tax=Pseudoxanthomonas sp. TaxID=1871049 RepID=UPI003F810116